MALVVGPSGSRVPLMNLVFRSAVASTLAYRLVQFCRSDEELFKICYDIRVNVFVRCRPA